jgi:opacity protein-like surface antigen
MGGAMKLFGVFLLTVCSFMSLAQAVDLVPISQQAIAGNIVYSFTLVDGNKNISDSDLNISHEKLIHFIVYDKSLTQFEHVHPVFDGKKWNVELNLGTNGDYKVWAQGELVQGSTEFSVNNNLKVTGGAPELPAPVELGDVRKGVAGITQVELSNAKLKEGKMAMLDLTITQTNGVDPKLEPYLGAFAHVIAVPLDGSDLIHVHPMDGSMPNMGMLHTEFPLAGDYRLWVQFINNGDVLTIPLSVRVYKK